MIHPDDALVLFDFSDPVSVNDWAAIDDRVMGGVSRSRLRHDPAGHAVFEGLVSLEERRICLSAIQPKCTWQTRRRDLLDRGARRWRAVQAQPPHR
ncbi:MAG TPA: CIA30 family protein [Rubrivivax sp.]|nr:CIA30 family protein [Rubrivivax sp.]